jgi:hypothetical protein
MDNTKFLWVFPLPHVKFIPVLPPEGVEMRQFVPPEPERRESEAFPWYAVYYKGRFGTPRLHTMPCLGGRRTLVLSMILSKSPDVSSYAPKHDNLCAVCA